MSITSADTAREPEEVQRELRRLARADLYRFLAACYYEPGVEFAEERLFDSMFDAASRLDADLAARARRLGQAFFGEAPGTLAVDYARLFLGAPQMLAKPYGSAWMPGEGALMQYSTMAAAALYREGGFDLDERFRELPDHISAELEFLYLLHYSGADSLRRRFLREHLGRWIPYFAGAVEARAETPFYRQLAQLTERMVGTELGV